MIVMPANNTGMMIGSLFGRFPGRLGHLHSPGSQRGPYNIPGYSYALDNGRFKSRSKWSERRWVQLLEWAKLSGMPPRWLLVPDVVGNKQETLKEWSKYSNFCRAYGWPLAIAVQDGFIKRDVPSDADVVFVGGSTKWKMLSYRAWCSSFPRVHVGRVNTYNRLMLCHRAGAESCDGTGFTMHPDKTQELERYLEETR